MSRATIRAAMAAWLAPPAVAGINTVYRGQPKIIPGQAFFAGVTGVNSGCVAMIHIARDTEKRIAIGGPTSGKKRIDYTVEFRLLYRLVRSASTTGGDAGLDATDEFDAIVDALKARIRADRTANSAAIWQWGEADLGGTYSPMKETANGVEMWCSISTVVTEWLTT